MTSEIPQDEARTRALRHQFGELAKVLKLLQVVAGETVRLLEQSEEKKRPQS